MICNGKEKIFVFGAGGHGKVVIDVVERHGLFEVAVVVDDDPAQRGREFFGYRVIGGKEELLSQPDAPKKGIVAIGLNPARAAIADWLTSSGITLVTAIHPSAQLGRGAMVGPGTVVMAGAVINSDATIGANVIVNTRASIDHDCVIGDAVHIAPGCTLCGTVTVGDGSFVCSGSTVLPNLNIGKGVTIGAGSTVIRDVSDGMLVAGVPARCLRK